MDTIAGPTTQLLERRWNGVPYCDPKAAPELLDACKGMLGLCTLIVNRDDIPADLREHLMSNHRVIDAKAAVEHAERHVHHASDGSTAQERDRCALCGKDAFNQIHFRSHEAQP